MTMKRVLGYLKYTQDYALHYNKYSAVLEGYSDANWITGSNEVKSTSGYVFTIGGGAVSWKSSKQTCIARSTMESKFIALDKAGEKAEWLRNFLEDIPYWPKPVAPICIHYDRQAAIGRAGSMMYNGKSRHIRRRYNTIRKLLSSGIITIDYVKSKDNVSDPLTKGLSRELVERTSKGMGLRSRTSQHGGLSPKPHKKVCRQKVPFLVLSVVKGTQSRTKRSSGSSISRKDSNFKLILSEGRDNDDRYGCICPGCGIFMQDEDPDLPGYYKKKKVEESLGEDVEDFVDDEDVVVGEFGDNEEEEEELFGDYIEGELEENVGEETGSGREDGFEDWDSEEWESELEEDEIDLKELDGFMPAGVGYGNITEEVLEKETKKRVSKSERKRMARNAAKGEKEEVTVCARCHSLRNYGQVKNEMAENLIPDFDFDQLITSRLMKPTGKADATVVVMVVDCVDFDGSFPKRAAKSLFKALEQSTDGFKQSKRLPKLVLVATKVDLLPSQISPARLDKWVRHRAKANGAPKLSGVYMVSSRKDLGIRNLLAFIKELAGPRGNVWVIGAQNAGKSTLINAFAKKGGVKATKLTEAPVPGTTLGILRIGGILSAKAKMYDTPGLLHPYLLSMRLNREEQKMAEIRKELQPRTYRIKAS
ncbi:hypothetical protein CQW23_08632 [Capsicum baccatum]|uniref:CP-type G domain-containing protein n=1 Tax=Capsicum baccatum TaxID=33114 RepID=A0A2G2X9L5_CAPBA|nr:hypothetical protein CQW23_08632 [Capsicum baccatum]